MDRSFLERTLRQSDRLCFKRILSHLERPCLKRGVRYADRSFLERTLRQPERLCFKCAVSHRERPWLKCGVRHAERSFLERTLRQPDRLCLKCGVRHREHVWLNCNWPCPCIGIRSYRARSIPRGEWADSVRQKEALAWEPGPACNHLRLEEMLRAVGSDAMQGGWSLLVPGKHNVNFRIGWDGNDDTAIDGQVHDL